MTTRIELQRGDILTLTADVIVSAGTSSLLGSPVLDAAGPGVLSEVQRIRETSLTNGLAVGEAVATNAGNLPAKWIVHTVGPEYAADEESSAALTSSYVTSIELADKLGAVTAVIPAIGSALGWTKDEDARIAVEALRSTETHLEVVTIAVTDDTALAAFERALAASLTE